MVDERFYIAGASAHLLGLDEQTQAGADDFAAEPFHLRAIIGPLA